MLKPVPPSRRLLYNILYQKEWLFSAASAPKLDPDQPIEEERTPYYSPETFFPARLGEVLNGQYQLVTKLGYGSSSTVWLARDLARYSWQADRFLSVKINAVQGSREKDTASNELRILETIQRTGRSHKGWPFVRTMTDNFVLRQTGGAEHLCFVFDPLREPLWLFRRRFKDSVFPPDVLKIILQQVLIGLDFLHTECRIIHTDLKLDNIMVKAENMQIFERDALNEYEDPLPRKQTDDRTIYLSRNNYGPPSEPIGVVQLVDFGYSVPGDTVNYGAIQAEVYRAPEVILDAGYSYSADIWSLGVMLWDLLQGQGLFDAADPGDNNDQYDDEVHLAHITALLGPIPASLVQRGRRSSLFYDDAGAPKYTAKMPQDFSFDSMVQCMDGQEKEMFITFVKRMLTWQPHHRSTAKQLLEDPWLYTDE